MNAYSITAPEEIAKKYGGNKKKIQQATTQGLINPTEAVMAGMFIDRMRNAAAQEQAQQPTVAEQVMNPQPQMPPQGMAATPQAQQMAQRPPQMGMPQQMPQQMPPQGMAMGGGVNSIDYVEGNYAPGGIVSFAAGDPVRMGVTDDQLRNMSRAQLRAVASNGQIPPHIRNAASARLQSITPAPGQQPTVGGLAAEDLPRVPNVSGAMDRVGQAIMGTGDVDRNIEVSDAGITPRGSAGSSPDLLSMGVETFADGMVSRPDQGQRIDPNRFNTGTLTEAEARRIEGKPDVAGLAGTPEAAAMENASPGGRRITDPAEIARLEATPEGRAQAASGLEDRRGTLAEQVARMRAGADSETMVGDGALRDMGRSPFGLEQQFDRQQPTTTVTDQVARTEAATTTPAPETKPEAAPETAPAAEDKESKPADTDMSISEQFNVFQKEMSGLMPKPEYGEYRKKFEGMINNFDETKKQAKKDGFNMALVQAGLGMLAQGGGQNALQALGKAALPATKQYASAMKDLKKEERELFKLGLSLEQMDAKERAEADKTMVNLFGKKLAGEYQIKAQQIASDKKTDAQRKTEALMLSADDPKRQAVERLMQQEIEVAQASSLARVPGQAQERALDVAKFLSDTEETAGKTFDDPLKVGERKKEAEALGITVPELRERRINEARQKALGSLRGPSSSNQASSAQSGTMTFSSPEAEAAYNRAMGIK